MELHGHQTYCVFEIIKFGLIGQKLRNPMFLNHTMEWLNKVILDVEKRSFRKSF